MLSCTTPLIPVNHQLDPLGGLFHKMKTLYNRAWEKNLEELIETDTTSQARFIELGTGWNPKRVLVRDEYGATFHRLEELAKAERGVVITGQPGIGKYRS